jgi:hypothetical protein
MAFGWYVNVFSIKTDANIWYLWSRSVSVLVWIAPRETEVGHSDCLSIFVLESRSQWPRSKAWICGRSFAEIAGSNPAGGHGCLLWVLCVVRYRSLRRAHHSSGGVLLSVVWLGVIVKLQQSGGFTHWRAVERHKKDCTNKDAILRICFNFGKTKWS